MSLNTKLATAPNTTDTYVLKASGTTIGNSIMYQDSGGGMNVAYSGTTGGARIRITPDTPQGYIESYDSSGNFYKLVLATGGLSVRNGLSTSLLEISTAGAGTFSSSVTAGGSSVGATGIDSLRILNSNSGGGNLIIENTSTILGKIGVISEDVGSGTFNDGVFKVQLAVDGTLQDRLTISSRGGAVFSSLGTGAVYSSSGLLTNTAPAITATGGTITTSGGYKYHTFTTSGTFSVSSGTGTVEVAVVAGGGAGSGLGNGAAFYSGAGGAGGVVYHPSYLVNSGSYTVTVGGGGASGTAPGNNGGNSVFDTITALGGGGGGTANGDNPGTAANVGLPGGSGGGGGSQTGVGGLSTKYLGGGIPYGNNGGTPNGVGGGGGGAGTVGGIGKDATMGGSGILIFNLGSRIAGGGGGGSFGNQGTNAVDGGGIGGYWNGTNADNSFGANGTTNTGGGGGGAGYNFATGGSGGSGIVIIRYKV